MEADPMPERGAGAADRALGLVAKLTGELASAGKANRQLLEHLVVGEIERVALRLGFARTEDVTALRREVEVLTAEVATLRAEVDEAAAAATSAAPTRSTDTPASTTRRPRKSSATSSVPAPAATTPPRRRATKAVTSPSERSAHRKPTGTAGDAAPVEATEPADG